jgi:GntR family transcriptional regulator, transcriptional repressor for pyruvate dehydrogenase complex
MGRAVRATESLTAKPEQVDRAQFETINDDFLHHDILFHRVLIERSGNHRLVASVNGWRDVITAQRGWRLAEPRDLPHLYAEHERILRAVRARDPLAAASAMRDHLVATGSAVMKELQRADPEAGDFDPLWYDGITPPPAIPGQR